jgi:hypothetical protein
VNAVMMVSSMFARNSTVAQTYHSWLGRGVTSCATGWYMTAIGAETRGRAAVLSYMPYQEESR